MRATVRERFDGKVAFGRPDECWPISGYAQRAGHIGFSFNGRQIGAHRIAWILTNGPIPDGLCVLHHCDNPPCVNVNHLWLGTVGDNNADRDAKGRGRLPRPEQIRRQQAGPVKHGTIYAYVKRKCRCSECRAAIREYRHHREAAAQTAVLAKINWPVPA